MFVRSKDGVHSEERPSWQHSCHAERHIVRDFNQVLEIVHYQVFDVAIGNAIEGIEDNAVALGESAILGHVGAERLDHAGHLVAGEQGGIAHPIMRQGHRVVAFHWHVSGQAATARDRRQTGQTWRSSGMITRTRAYHPDTGTVRWHIRYGHIEAEDAVPTGHVRAFDRELTAQLIHFLSVTSNWQLLYWQNI